MKWRRLHASPPCKWRDPWILYVFPTRQQLTPLLILADQITSHLTLKSSSQFLAFFIVLALLRNNVHEKKKSSVYVAMCMEIVIKYFTLCLEATRRRVVDCRSQMRIIWRCLSPAYNQFHSLSLVVSTKCCGNYHYAIAAVEDVDLILFNTLCRAESSLLLESFSSRWHFHHYFYAL